MRLLIVSDSPALRSGLGRVVRELARRFVDDGDEVAVAGWFHTVAPAYDEDLPYGIIPCGKREPETVDLAIDHVEPDVVLAIGDPEDFQALARRRVQRGGFLLAGYFNIESEPIPPHLEVILDSFDVLRTSSLYGATVVGRREVVGVQYGVDTAVFHPKTPPGTVFGRDMASTFVVLVNGQNTQRKNIATGIQGFARFAQRKDNVLLYLNTQLVSNPGEIQGPNLAEVIAESGIGHITYATNPPPGPLSDVRDHALNDMYAMATVLLSPSWAEGFGLPILEAMATRTVPVATKGFSHLELLDSGRGFLISPATVVRGYHGHDLFMVSPDGVRMALSTAYQQWLSGTIDPVMDAGLAYAQVHTWDATYEAIAEAVHSGQPPTRVATGQPIDAALRAKVRRLRPRAEAIGVLKMGGLGDMLQLTAVVDAVRRKYDRPITLFSNSPWAEKIFANVDVEHVRIPSMPQEVALRSLADRFDIFLDVRYVSRTYGEPETDYFSQHRWMYDHWAESCNRLATLGEHSTQIILRSLGLDGPITPVYPFRQLAEVEVGEESPTWENARSLALCSGAGHPLKAWPGWDHLAAELSVLGWGLVQIGGATDPAIPGAIDRRGLSLPLTASLLEQVHALITTEGAMHHLAAAVGCKAFVILGPTPAVSFLYPGQVPITVGDRCSPCFWSVPMWPRAECALGEKACVRFPSTDQVLMEVAR